MSKRTCSLLAAGLAVTAIVAHGTEPLNIGDRRELFLDDLLVERLEGDIARRFHEPVAREIVMTFDQPWEGNSVNYLSVFQDGERYRMYYRASGYTVEEGHLHARGGTQVAYAESRDGIDWVRPHLGHFEFEGSRNNNIVWVGRGSSTFTVFKDRNPACLPQRRYKALGRGPGGLHGFYSEDGLQWRAISEHAIIEDADFGSATAVFWDPNVKVYRAYYRFHQVEEEKSWTVFHALWPAHERRRLIRPGRDIKTSVTADFNQWPSGEGLLHRNAPGVQFDSTVIAPYHRAPHIYIGIPSTYHDRGWTPALERLPDLERRRLESGISMRSGTALTDTLLMWSRDGVAFTRAPNTFLRPGPERPGSWMYGSHWTGNAWVETPSTLPGADPELSFYVSEFYRKGPAVKLRRHTLRLDGFASLRASIDGGELTTPPIIFEGSALSMNFATSASGSVRVELQDAEGTPIPGFTLADSIELFGDTVARNAMWRDDPDLSALAGRPVRLRFVMRDADLYSIKFE